MTVSKDFDATLSDVIALAAGAAQTEGAHAARVRGRTRTMRKRIAISSMSVALVAVGAGAAVSAVGASPAHKQAAATPSVSFSTPANGGTATPSPSAGQAAPSPSASTGTAATTSVSAPPSSSAATPADPHVVVQAAWLTPQQMPLWNDYHWKQMHLSGSYLLSSTVAYIPDTTTLQVITACGDPGQLLHATIGAQSVSDEKTVGSDNAQSNQYIFFYSSADAAKQAFTSIQDQYGPSCLPGSHITKTAGDGVTSQSWEIVKASSGAVDQPAAERDYFVLEGSTIAFVGTLNYNGPLPATNDAATLSVIASDMSVYRNSAN
jgi:hypothetical protein